MIIVLPLFWLFPVSVLSRVVSVNIMIIAKGLAHDNFNYLNSSAPAGTQRRVSDSAPAPRIARLVLKRHHPHGNRQPCIGTVLGPRQ